MKKIVKPSRRDVLKYGAASAALAPKTVPSEVEARLKTVLPDEMSPREALEVLYQLKQAVASTDL